MTVRLALLTVCLVGFAAAGFGVASDGDTPKGQSTKFKVTTKRADDAVEVQTDEDRAVISVRSPSGIGQVVIERVDEKWPGAVVVRLHLKGLESFRASNGMVTLDAAVSSQGGKARVWKDGKEDAPLDAKSPFWLEIRMVGGDGKPTNAIPLKDGYFKLMLPRALFEGNPTAITLNWIDFYRN